MFRPPNAFRGTAAFLTLHHGSGNSRPPPSPAVSFWQRDNVRDHVKKLQETIEVSRALANELEEIAATRDSGDASVPESDPSSSAKFALGSGSPSQAKPLDFIELARALKIGPEAHESMAIDAANYLCYQLQHLLAPISSVINQSGPWEERSAMVRLTQKLHKAKRNKRWRKRKRKHVAELYQKEREDYERIDQEADEWRARQIAKDIAKRKVESMKEIAKKKANEERKRLESELELVIMVEKLQELRSIRVQKLKKQGHFLPEEDDKYLERVKAAVEEEERQAATAARTDAVKDAILTAEESRRAKQCTNSQEDGFEQSKTVPALDKNQGNAGISETNDQASRETAQEGHKVDGKVHGHDPVNNLPFEFYHYYHGSSYDLGTLIEVRRMWDSFIRPGGSRIPGHWVQPPPPADEVWASYLVQPK
ncbi:hypothetical protein PR202_gb27198 [Eleusine coracana subsp. coracana]|uniref:Uncharacterized protein n=1 Tax=Eleusine coracana subsp. coracana TaxID=191504 RepID=A0AAV5FTV1_ELECO|nr:hypothetical protein PR202_gb27198 [Eleusine coracana subsp. coracana]